MVQPALVVDPQTEAADEVGVGDDDPLGARVGQVELGFNGVGAPEEREAPCPFARSARPPDR